MTHSMAKTGNRKAINDGARRVTLVLAIRIYLYPVLGVKRAINEVKRGKILKCATSAK